MIRRMKMKKNLTQIYHFDKVIKSYVEDGFTVLFATSDKTFVKLRKFDKFYVLRLIDGEWIMKRIK